MKIYKQGTDVPFKTSIAIGMFDGVHRGHQLLIKKAIGIAEERNLTPMVYTFSSHPLKQANRKYLTLFTERVELISRLGINNIYVAKLNESFMNMSPLEFVKREIVRHANAKSVVVGENFRFGKNREGDTKFLCDALREFGIELFSEHLVYYNGKPVSSSTIYNLITDGNISEANDLLGYAFFLGGKIVKGKGIGRLLGFPTANLRYENGYKVLPKNGVYVTMANVNGTLFESLTNVGRNPTFEESKKIKVEIHFIDEKLDLYGKNVRLHFLKRIREEKKFPTPSLLIDQIRQDLLFAKEFFKKAERIKITL